MQDEITPTEDTQQEDAVSDARAGRQMSIGALIVTAFLVASKTMGYVKEMLLSGLGANRATDAYKIAYNGVITVIYTKVEKLLRPTYLPEFVKVRREQGEEAAWQVTSVMAGFQFLLLTALAALCVVFARPILLFAGPGLADSPEDLERGVFMLRLMAPALLLFSLSVMPELTLHAYKKFTLPAVAEACFRMGVVVVFVALIALVWPGRPPDAIYAAPLAVLFGSCLRFFVQLPGLRDKLRMFRFTADVAHSPSAMAIFRLMPPVVIGLIFSTIRTIADTRFGSDIGEGVYTCLDFARKVPDLLLLTLPLAVSFVVYPFLSEWALRGETDKMADALVKTTRAMAFIFVPASVALMIVSLPVIRLMFQHGNFTGDSAELSALGVYWYSPGLVFYSLDAAINHWYFAFKDTGTPNYIGALFAILHVAIGYTGVYHLGTTTRAKLSWIAAALTVSKSGKVAVLYAMIRKRLGHIDSRAVWAFAVKLALCTALMGIVMWKAEAYTSPIFEAWNKGVKLTALAGMGTNSLIGIAVFLITAAVTRVEEISIVWDAIRKVQRKLSAKLGRPGA